MVREANHLTDSAMERDEMLPAADAPVSMTWRYLAGSLPGHTVILGVPAPQSGGHYAEPVP